VALTFEWDPGKARQNLAKHGIDFAEAATVFEDRLSLTIPDPAHSIGEQRFLTMGISFRRRLVVVAHVDTDGGIRIISARRASGAERRQYEEGS